MYRELLLGCGSRRVKDERLPTAAEICGSIGEKFRFDAVEPDPITQRIGIPFQNLFTLDIEASHKPDVVFDLRELRYSSLRYRALLPWPEIPRGIPDPKAYELAMETYHANCDSAKAWNDASNMEDDFYDEIHAYEVLEHCGDQGDYRMFFAQFSEFWRVLKPGGFFFGTCPSWSSPWAWGDPSHSRVLTSGTLAFLSQAEYKKQVGVTPMSDFRSCYKADFLPIVADDSDDTLLFVLQAVKPE